MTVKVAADTNVLISAVIYGGVSEQVLGLAQSKEIELLTSPEILTEFANVLYRKFGFSSERVREAIARIQRISTTIFPLNKLSVIIEDEPDNRILECAVEGEAHYIVSGDKRHLLSLKEYRGILILSPADLVKLI